MYTTAGFNIAWKVFWCKQGRFLGCYTNNNSQGAILDDGLIEWNGLGYSSGNTMVVPVRHIFIWKGRCGFFDTHYYYYCKDTVPALFLYSENYRHRFWQCTFFVFYGSWEIVVKALALASNSYSLHTYRAENRNKLFRTQSLCVLLLFFQRGSLWSQELFQDSFMIITIIMAV